MELKITNKNNLIKYFVIVLLALLTFTLTGCEDDSLDYSDFVDDHLLTWQNVLDKDEDQYLVYYYGDNCSHCKTIKEDVLTFALSNQADLKVYFINSSQVASTDYQMYPVYDPTTNEAIPGTPTILVVKDGKLKAMEVGPTIIKDLLEQINEGSYGFID